MVQKTGVTGEAASGSKALTFNLLGTSILAALGSFNFGYNLSVVNTSAKTFRTCPADASVWACFPVDEIHWGFVAGIMCLGALFGSFAAGPLANSRGRRACILANNVPYLAGFLLLALAQNYYMLLAGRFLVGVGVGGSCIGVPMYLTELATVHARGLIGTVHQMGICTGILMGEVIPLFGLWRPVLWRIMFAMGAIPVLIQIIGMIAIAPESPRYLFNQQRAEAGRRALQFLRGPHYDEGEAAELIANATSHAGTGKAGTATAEESWSLWDLLWRRVNVSGRSMLVAAILHIGQQVSGINCVLLFSDSIFTSESQTSPVSTGDSMSLVPVSIASLNLLMTIAAVLAIDLAGRRFLALSSSGVMCASGILLTAAFLGGWRLASILSVLAFVGSFAFGMGPVPWLMTNELFPTAAVGSAVSFAVGLNWIANLSVSISFPTLRLALGHFAFLPYALCMGAFFLFSLFMLPETKGRPLGFI